MAFTLRTHETQGGRTVVRPYTRIMVQGYPPVFAQEGKFFSENGEEYDPLPPGIENELQKMSREALTEVGLDPDNPLQPIKPPVERRVRPKKVVAETEEQPEGDDPEGDPADDADNGTADVEAAAKAAPARTTRRKRAT